jgi:hypothetical protein
MRGVGVGANQHLLLFCAHGNLHFVWGRLQGHTIEFAVAAGHNI